MPLNRLQAAALLLFLSGGAQAAGPPELYVWQRQWTPAVGQSLMAAADLASGWRLLAATARSDGSLARVEPDWEALAQAKKPVTAVVRIEGSGGAWVTEEGRLTAALQSLADDWRCRALKHGLTLTGLEVDHDSATRRLAAYGRFLKGLRGGLDARLHLSATGLPAWLDSPDLPQVLAPLDEFVLQVHSLEPNRQGLFEAGRARRWADLLAARTSKPFRLALPDFGVGVTRRADGSVAAFIAESPRPDAAPASEEWAPRPREVAGLLKDLEAAPPPHWAGVVWYRLPITGDRRGWSLPTLRAVIRGDEPESRAIVGVEPGKAPGLSLLVLRNHGPTDAVIPQSISLPEDCNMGDGANGFSWQAGPRPALTHPPGALLRPDHHLALGWTRCAKPPESFDVEE